MQLVAVPARVGMRGFDTSAKLTASQVAALRALGLEFAVRYVALTTPEPQRDLDREEIELIAGAGFDLSVVQHPRERDWSATTGTQDAQAACVNAAAIGIPHDVTLWLDLEGAIPTAAATIAYANAWWQVCASRGWDTGVYVGPGIPLTSQQLYDALSTRHYWRSAASVPNVAHRGYEMLQLWPGNLKMGGTVVDLDVVQQDYLGSVPTFARAA